MERGGSTAGPGCTVFARNIPDGSRVEDVRRLFDRFGHVYDVTLPLDYYTGRIKGYAFVEYPF
jgi:RNA recognition motif-containing protein